eukprot:2933231-Alexandrium_andersonii.AAC.1
MQSVRRRRIRYRRREHRLGDRTHARRRGPTGTCGHPAAGVLLVHLHLDDSARLLCEDLLLAAPVGLVRGPVRPELVA